MTVVREGQRYWKHGDHSHVWIVDAIGQERFLAPAIRKLREGEFKGKTVYFRVREGDELKVKTLEPVAPAEN